MDRRLLVRAARFAAVIALMVLWRPESAAAYGAAAVVLCLVLVPDAAPTARREPIRRRLEAPAVRGDFAVGYALLRAGRLEDAERAFRRALDAEADDADARFNLGIVLAETGRHEEAIAELETASRLRPRDAAVRYRLGVSNAAVGRHFAAIHALRESIRLDPFLVVAGRALEHSLAAVSATPGRTSGAGPGEMVAAG